MFSLLYVDDEPGLLELGKLFLEHTGEFGVTIARSGDEGLAQLAQHDFDAIVSDFQMPGMDGIELLKNVRKSFGTIPFVLFTGRGREEVVVEAINNGVDFYLQKGGDPKAQFAELAHKVRQAVNRRRAEILLSDSEQRLADIINFLPDATFAIDTRGVVIAWNRAMERMTGFPAEEILGKGDYEYALPFYHERRPLLINLVLDDDTSIGEKYPFVKKEARTLFSEITIPHFNEGSGAALWFTASPLYNRMGDIVGAIESIRDITERKQADAALSDSERKYRTAFETANEGILTTDAGFRTASANRKMQEMFGYSEQEMMGRLVWDFVPPEESESMKQELFKRPEGIPGRYERKWVRKDGTTLWCLTSATPLFSPDGIFIGSFGMFTDITERRQMEEALKTSEEENRIILKTAMDGFCIVDMAGLFIDFNDAFCNLHGYTREELFALSLPRIEVRENPEEAARQAKEIIRKGCDRFETKFRRKDGRINDVEVSVVYSRIHGGCFIAFFRDITERKRAEEALRESGTKFRAVIDQSFQLIGLMNPDGTLIEANRAALALVGISESEVINRPFWETPWWSHSVELQVKLKDAVHRAASGETVRFEATHPDADGHVTYVDFSVKPVVDPTGKVLYLIPEGRDITERKHAEEALFASQQMLQAVLDSIPQRVFWKDRNSVFLGCNKPLALDAGYADPADMVRKTDYDHASHATADLYRADDRQVLESGQPRINYEEPQIRPDGSHAWLRTTKMPLRNKEGTIIGVLGTYEDITDRKRTEEALRESEEKFRALVETTSDFIWEVDTGGRYTYISPQVRQILGYEPEELVGKTPFEIMPSGEADRVAAEFNRYIMSRSPITALENKAIRKDGSVVILETSGVIRTAKDGNYRGYRGIDRDITTRKQAEDSLRESETRLRSILLGSPVLQFVIDRNHRVISWNKAIEEYSGIKAADVIGTDQQWRAFYADKRPVLADLLIDGNTDAIDRLYTRKPKRSRYVEEAYEATDFFPPMGSSGVWLSFTAAPIRDDQGGIIGAVETLEDVTERVNAETALRDSEDRTRTILNTAQVGIVLVDAVTHEIVDANKKALELIGLDRDLVINAVCHRFICPAEEGKCPVTDCGQTVNTSERVLITAAGENIPVLKTVVPVSISGRSVLVESFVDISEQKRSETAIREANRKLNLLNSITRHDIRNQLMVAQGFTQLAALSKPDAIVTDFLAKISTAIETIERQIEFTKAYQELGVHAPSWFRVDEVISSVRPERIALRNACKAVEIFADPMIDKVFFNLFDNAVKYGEHVTAVTVGCEEIDDYLVITFSDNGCGIPPDEKKKIFGKGYGKNTGLGLFLAREILAITGIAIHENGTFGEGAVFEIIVPKGAYRKPE